MIDFIPWLLIIPLTYNIVHFFKNLEKLATKYKDPNHNEEYTVRGIGEEYQKQSKLLKIRFLVIQYVLVLILFISLWAGK